MKKILIVAAALVAVILCSCRKEEDVQPVAEEYSVKYVESSFRVMVGHEEDLRSFRRELYATVYEKKYEHDTSAIAAVDSLVDRYNHRFIAGNFTLCKGREGGSVQNLKDYQLVMTKYSVSAVIERPVFATDMESEKGAKFSVDSARFVKEIDEVITRIHSGYVKDEDAMKLLFSGIETKWNNPAINKEMLANYWLFRDNDTIGKFAVRLPNLLDYHFIGDSAVTGRETQLDSLRNDLTKALKTCSDSGYSSYDVSSISWNAVKAYQMTSLNGVIFVFQREANNAGTESNYEDENGKFVRRLNIQEVPGTEHKRSISISYYLEDAIKYLDAEYSHGGYYIDEKYPGMYFYQAPCNFYNFFHDDGAKNINEEVAKTFEEFNALCNKAQDDDDAWSEVQDRWTNGEDFYQFNGRSLSGTITFKVSAQEGYYNETVTIYPYISDLQVKIEPENKDVSDSLTRLFKKVFNWEYYHTWYLAGQIPDLQSNGWWNNHQFEKIEGSSFAELVRDLGTQNPKFWNPCTENGYLKGEWTGFSTWAKKVSEHITSAKIYCRVCPRNASLPTPDPKTPYEYAIPLVKFQFN